MNPKTEQLKQIAISKIAASHAAAEAQQDAEIKTIMDDFLSNFLPDTIAAPRAVSQLMMAVKFGRSTADASAPFVLGYLVTQLTPKTP